MKFNDYNITSEKDSEYINKCYNKVFKQEIEDLNEIISKMENQRETLQSANDFNKYDHLIEKITSDIEKLKNIVHSTMNTKSSPITYNLSIPNSFRQATKLNENEYLSPVRSIEENERHESFSENLPSIPNDNENATLPNNLPNETISTPTRQPGSNGNDTFDEIIDRPKSSGNIRTRSTRRSPLGNFSLASIFQRFAIKNKKSATKIALHNRMRYHTVIATHCPHEKMIHHNQIDIIRLLLLYLTLRPHCRYASVISRIANDQLDCYVEMTEIK